MDWYLNANLLSEKFIQDDVLSLSYSPELEGGFKSNNGAVGGSVCVLGARLSCRAQNTVGEETGHIKIIYEGNEDDRYSSAPESLISSAKASYHSAVISSKCKYYLDMDTMSTE